MRRLKMVCVVEWNDAYSQFGVGIDSEAPKLPVRSVGFLLDADEERVVIAPSYNGANECDKIVIPKGMVKRIILYKEDKKWKAGS